MDRHIPSEHSYGRYRGNTALVQVAQHNSILPITISPQMPTENAVDRRRGQGHSVRMQLILRLGISLCWKRQANMIAEEA